MLCRRFSELVGVLGGVGVEPACCLEVEMFVCVCLEWNALCREESAQLPTRLPPCTDKFSRRRHTTSSTYCSQIFISVLFVPGPSAADNRPPLPPHPRRVSGTGRDVTTRAANWSLQTQPGAAHAPQTLPLIALSLLRHAGASTTQVDAAEFYGRTERKRHNAPRKRLERRQRFN